MKLESETVSGTIFITDFLDQAILHVSVLCMKEGNVVEHVIRNAQRNTEEAEKSQDGYVEFVGCNCECSGERSEHEEIHENIADGIEEPSSSAIQLLCARELSIS